MKRINAFLYRLRALFRRETLDVEMREEMEHHLELSAAKGIADDESDAEARYAAQRKFGGVEQIKEHCRDERGFMWLDQFIQDLRYAARQLRGRPGFTLTAVLTLAVGIGANTALFTVGNTLLFRGLTADRPHELVTIFFGDAERNGTDNHSYPDYLDYRRETTAVLTDLAAFTVEQAALVATEQTERICAGFVTENYFAVLGARPLLGRDFAPEENRTPGAHPVAVISEGLWRHRFGGASDVLGRSLGLNNGTYTIVGVMPEATGRMLGVLKVDVFVPAVMRHDPVTERGNKEFMVLGRLRPGVTAEEAQARCNVLAAQMAQAHPREWTSGGRAKPLTIVPAGNMPFGLRGYASAFFAALLALASVVLLVVCANLAGLLLARGTARRREIAVRLALGASRSRIVRQLLTESLLLSLVGGASSLGVAHVAVRALAAFTPDVGVPLLVEAGFDARVLAFNVAVSLAAAAIFGLAPALQVTRPDVMHGLKAGDIMDGPGVRRRVSLRHLLVVGQLAASLVLLLGAGMFLRSLGKLSSLSLGFEPDKLALLSVDLSLHGYSTERAAIFHAQAIERLQALPAVESVAAARRVPFGLSKVGQRFVPEGATIPAEEALFGFNLIGPRYFETLKIPVPLGRGFAPEDREGAPRVAVINETMARLCWPDANPIGKRLLIEGSGSLEVIGVCRTSKYHSLRERPQPFVYLPWKQHATPAITFHVRTRGDAAASLGGLRDAVEALDRRVTVFDVKTMTEHLAVSMLRVRLGATLLGLFGGLAFGLAALGLYGMMAYIITQRTREIGIRMALGAPRRRVLGAVLRTGATLTLSGAGIGMAVGSVLTAVIASQFYGITGADMLTLGGVVAALVGVALLACALPARQATKVDPMIALRAE